MRAPKILLVKPPLDGHDRPIYDLIKIFREFNIDPIWPGLQQSWSQIIKTALEEDVDAIGISVHAGDPEVLFTHFKKLLNKAGLGDKLLIAGGSGEIALPEVQKALHKLGFTIFLAGTPREKIAHFILSHIHKAKPSKLLPRLLTQLENNPRMAVPTPKKRPFRIVFTGPPAVGKSSLINRFLDQFKGSKTTIGVALCDPRGPKQKGAFLGDRIVMQDHTLEKNIFIRSFSQKNVPFLNKVADLFGTDIVIFETIGIGQEGIAHLRELADLLVWVALPQEADTLRLLKGGPHELADVAILNKIDLEAPFQAELALQEHFKKPYFKVSTLTGEGLDPFFHFVKERI